MGSGVSVPTEAWDKKNKRIKPLNNRLIALQSELDNAVQALVNIHNKLTVIDEIEVTPENFKDAVRRLKEGKEGITESVLTFNQWVKEFIKETADGQRTNQLGLPIGHRTVQKYNTVKKHLDAFSKKVWGREIRFEEIDSRFLEQYKKFRGDQGLGVNTIAKDQAVLKTPLK